MKRFNIYRTQLRRNYLLLIILVLGAILRLYHIDFQSIWLDEIHTVNEANPNLTWAEFYKALLNSEPHPPLYFALVRVLFYVFGYKTIVLRLFSAVLGIAGIYAIYLLGKEICNRKTGLIAAALLAVNSFHLYHSQDGRPYVFLVLFTILSFWRFSLFLKEPSRKNAILYGVFAALMIYGHFFGLFALFAQYVTLLFFIIISERKNRSRFLGNSVISGIITGVLFLPALPLLIKSSEIKVLWIPTPTADIYTSFFKEFFGNSELLFPVAIALILVVLLKVSKQVDFRVNYNSITASKPVFNSIVITLWIVIVLLLPLIRSYLVIPMLVSRFFIVILPAIILLVSIGFYQIKNSLLRNLFLLLFVILSLNDILVVRKYYTGIMKAQFREATNFIKENNVKKEPVVTGLGWYLPYFLKNGKDNFEIIEKPLDAYIADMQSDSTKIKAFWYFDAHNLTYAPNPSSQEFIEKNFYIENNFDGFQAWTKHFVLLKDVPNVDISKFGEIKQTNGDNFLYNFDGYENTNNLVKANGWAFFENQEAAKTKIDLIFIKDGVATRLTTQKVLRPDVTSGMKSKFNIDDSGFSSTLDISKLASGTYKLGLLLVNKETHKEGLIITDKTIQK